jgi:hypothetical protein
MLRYRKGRNHFALDLRRERNLLTFKPYAQTAKFDLPEEEQGLPLILFTYQSEAFEKLKWLFCHKGKFDIPPQIIFSGINANRLKAYLRMESSHFPTADLAKSFGMDFILEKKIEEVRFVVASEALVRAVHTDLFADAFLNSDPGICQLQLREEGSAHYLPDYRSGTCISTEAEIICPKNS